MKRILCVLLTAALIITLAASCSGSNTVSSPSPSASAPATDNAGNAGTTPSESGYVYTPIDWGEYPASDVGQDILKFDMVGKTKDLPLTDERVTFTAWWPISAGFATKFDNYADYPNMIELENRTNIHIDYYHPSANDVASNFPLMIASGDYADMIYYAGYYTGGGDRAIEDGVYIRLNELIDKYAPNYNAIRNYTDEARKMTITSSGNIWGFYNICKENMPGYMGLNIRKDYLDKMGYEGRPETIEDWDNVLGQMLDQIPGLQYALAIPPTGITRWSGFVSAWDVGSDWYQINGKVKYGPVEPDFRKYVELMKSWYDKGYLDKDFYGIPEADYNGALNTEYGAGAMGASDGSNMFGAMLYQFGIAADPDINIVAVRQPVLNRGDEAKIRFDQGVINGEQLAITTACKNPELLTSWVDYRYTFDGYMLIYYGIEGLTYRMTGDYHINITDNVINNEEGLMGMTALFTNYVASVLQVSLSDYTNGWCFLDPRYADEIKVWAQDRIDYNYPNISFLNAEDAAEFAATFADIETYVKETVPKFIIGSISMDKYDEFVNRIKAMGIDRCIELKQTVLDDFNSR